MKNYLIEFEVQAKGDQAIDFPLDMLRYDNCYPAKDSDAPALIRAAIYTSIVPNKMGSKPIKLAHQSHGNKKWLPTVRRWESMGYKVLGITGIREF